MKVTQEADHVSGRMVTIVAMVTIGVFAVGIAVAWWILTAIGAPRQPALPDPKQPIAKEINATDRWLFREPYGVAGQRTETQRLDSYGWVDRERGIIHIPITRAMELYLDRQADTTPAHVQPPPGQNLPEDTP
jgi:hypothetical protein